MSGLVLITGAAGNLGAKLRRHLDGRYPLKLLDREPRGDEAVVEADLSRYDASWTREFTGVDAVVHLAADPVAYRTWEELLAPNVDAMLNVYEAAAQAGVRRVVFASSNHVMGGYQHRAETITEDLPPLPGTRYTADGDSRDSTAYAAGKLFGERAGRAYSESRGLSVIAVRLGWVWHRDNRPGDLPAERGSWFRQMWLSNRDFCGLMEACIAANPALRFAVVNGMSRNTGMRWSMDAAKRLLGFEPQDSVDAS